MLAFANCIGASTASLLHVLSRRITHVASRTSLAVFCRYTITSSPGLVLARRTSIRHTSVFTLCTVGLDRAYRASAQTITIDPVITAAAFAAVGTCLAVGAKVSRPTRIAFQYVGMIVGVDKIWRTASTDAILCRSASLVLDLIGRSTSGACLAGCLPRLILPSRARLTCRAAVSVSDVAWYTGTREAPFGIRASSVIMTSISALNTFVDVFTVRAVTTVPRVTHTAV